ncbi:hypothetical protein PQX77_010972 [Marasmius sp. AFHP31]|nr:hypothetical protein PQX77_010972 [Marasmius sp. AFHP31]
MNNASISPKGDSQVGIDRFELEVLDDSFESPMMPSFSPPSSNSLGKSGPPSGPIIGATVGGSLLAVMIVVGLLVYRRRKRHRLASAYDDVNISPSEASFPTITPYPVVQPSISKGERPKAGESYPTPQRPPSPTPSSGSTAIVRYFRQRRERQDEMRVGRRPERQHEVDAGPVPLEDEEPTLPPLYEQVFQGGPLNRPPSGEIPRHSSPIAAVEITEK